MQPLRVMLSVWVVLPAFLMAEPPERVMRSSPGEPGSIAAKYVPGAKELPAGLSCIWSELSSVLVISPVAGLTQILPERGVPEVLWTRMPVMPSSAISNEMRPHMFLKDRVLPSALATAGKACLSMGPEEICWSWGTVVVITPEPRVLSAL